MQRTGVLQLDSVNVLARAHLMPLFSRMGPYDTGLLTRAAEQPPRRLVEYWAHVAAFMPVELWPHMQPRMRRHREQSEIAKQQPELVRSLLEEVRRRGPSTSRDLDDGLPRDRVKLGLELVEHPARADPPVRRRRPRRRRPQLARSSGSTTCRSGCSRRPSSPPPRRATRRPTASWSAGPRARSASPPSSACATTTGCRRRPCDRRCASLVEDGELVPVEVEEWGKPAFLHRDARVPRRTAVRTLLSPFDPVVWERDPHREAVRVPLPDRDLRPRAPAPVRLLRAAVPARRGARGAGRPQGRPQGAACSWSRPPTPSPAPLTATAVELAEHLRRGRAVARARRRRGRPEGRPRTGAQRGASRPEPAR